MDQLFSIGKKILKDKVSGGHGGHHQGGHNSYDNYENNMGYQHPGPNYGGHNQGYPPQQNYNTGGYDYPQGQGYGQPGPQYNNQGYPPHMNHNQGYHGAPYGGQTQYNPNVGNHSGGGGGGFGNPMSLFKTFDKDGDGRITENDFVIAIRQLGLGSVGESAIRSTFRKLDKNRNGKLDFGEAIGALGTLKSIMGGGGGHGKPHGYGF